MTSTLHSTPSRAGRRRRRPSRAGRPPSPAFPSLPAQLSLLATLFHRRWTAPVLAELWRGDSLAGGAKFITLVNRLKISRDSLKATLQHLIEHDFVLRNPGYGHPMRPEYILADAGFQLAPACRRLLAALRRRGWEDIGLRKWSLPVLYAMGHGVQRFGELRTVLPEISARALTLALKDLQSQGLIERHVIETYPPTTAYRVMAAARPIIAALGDLRIE